MRRYQVNFGFRISEFGIGLKTHGILHLFSIPKLILILSMAISIGCAKKEEVTPTPTGPTIVGVVKSEGKPLEGVTVSIEALGISSTTGSDGSFKMTDLVEGVYKVSFEKEGYVKKEVEVTVGVEGTMNIGEVVLELSGSIEGIAKIEGEEVHKGIKVRVMELEGFEVETDSEGRYEITGVPPGTYTIEISASGYEPKQIQVDVVGGKMTTAEEVTFTGVRKGILWEIGVPDNSYEEFRRGKETAAGGAWNFYPSDFPDDVTYIIGKSKPETDWNWIHPGPADAWAGNRAHPWKIIFEVPPLSGTCILTVDLANTHGAGFPPKVTIMLNDSVIKEEQTPLGTEAALTDPKVGKEYVITVEFPANKLKTGKNTITIVNDPGSWTMYDYIKFEVK